MQVPEKTFLQKYWLYLVLALVALGTSALLIYPWSKLTPYPRQYFLLVAKKAHGGLERTCIVTILCSIESRTYDATVPLRGRRSSARLVTGFL